ncbi:hypothetical protein [Actinomycetospora termitidis]|uniref:Uncharacterized protein n=1 Tax=Actinomycetospora termitidis TaxID=3053470 RepID=A0ABT7MHQ4_9PSEU|nr:hypothetical protein [Actinomycetospora sp. Odt1-22]MDL5160200.1 hypothetical protein [Actinomycetospora sp. Odt1-22]
MSRFVWGAFAVLFVGWGLWRGTDTATFPRYPYGTVSCGSPWSPNTTGPATSGLFSGAYSSVCDSINSGGLLFSILSLLLGAVCIAMCVRAVKRRQSAFTVAAATPEKAA